MLNVEIQMLIDIHFIDKNEYFSYFTSITVLHLADLDKYAFTQKLNKYKLMERKEFSFGTWQHKTFFELQTF